MKRILYILSFSTLLLNSGCLNNHNTFENDLFSLHPELQNKEVNLELLNKDTYNSYDLDSIFFENRIILLSVVGIGCGTCVDILDGLNRYQIESKFKNKFRIIIIAIGEENQISINEFKNSEYNFPIFKDEKMKFLQKNSIANYGFETFILNNKKIVLFGNPVDNDVINKYFSKLLKHQ